MRCASRPDLFGSPPECVRLGLREHIGHQQVVVIAERIESVDETDDVAGDEVRPLVDKLIGWPLKEWNGGVGARGIVM